MWPDHPQHRLQSIAPRALLCRPAKALSAGLELARGREARYLPGWSGQHSD